MKKELCVFKNPGFPNQKLTQTTVNS